MADRVNSETRSKIMRAVGRKDTGPELIVRSILWRAGFRYRLHGKSLPGTPDIYFGRFRKAIFVHGCFWHQHPNCSLARRPGSNQSYWDAKLDANVLRDKKAQQRLEKEGWSVAVVWQCETQAPAKLERRLMRFLKPR